MRFVRKARQVRDPNLRKANAGLNKYEREIYILYRDAFEKVRNQVGDQRILRDIVDALSGKNPAGVSGAFNWKAFLESLGKTAPTLTQQVIDTANQFSKKLPRKIRYEYTFDGKDPRAIAWAQTQAGKRIQGITLETQQAIANLISDGLRTNLTREQIIAQLRQTVGLDKRQSRALGTFYEKRLQKYLDDGMPYEKAAERAEKDGLRYRGRLLKQRAIRIARTEISAASNAGRYLSWEEADARGLLPPDSTKKWMIARDERACPICKPLDETIVTWRSPFATGDLMPPAHPNCRCTAVIIPGEVQVIKNVEKHLPGKHDQKTHAGGRGGGGLKGAVGYTEKDKHPVYDFNSDDGVNMEYYTSSGYREINEYLRNKGKRKTDSYTDLTTRFHEEDVVDYVNSIDKIMKKTKTPREMTTYRGITGEAAEQFKSLKEGDTFTDKGFISTTTQENQLWDFMDTTGKEFGVVLEITTPKDSKMISVQRYFSNVSSTYGPSDDILAEDEHILPRGTKFRVDGFGTANVRSGSGGVPIEDMVVRVSVLNAN